MWCRPEPSSVSPMYMPGRLRTASRPRRTLMESAPYSAGDCGMGAGSAMERDTLDVGGGVRKADEIRALREPLWGYRFVPRTLARIGVEMHEKPSDFAGFSTFSEA